MIKPENLISSVAREIKPSGIRKFFDIVATMPDVISLGIGEPDFVTPWHIRDAGMASLEKGQTYYTSNSGLTELRSEICKYLERRFDLSYNEKEVLVTVGGSEAIDLAFRALLNPGEEVIIPEPSFVCYSPCTLLAGGIPVSLPTYEKDDFRLSIEELNNKITDKTKILVLPYPNNPTGAILEKDDLVKIAEVIKGTNIIVLADEIYAELTYGKKHCSIANIKDMKERTVLVSGFSKSYAMTGWRLGYAVGNASIIKAMTKVHQFAIMSAPTTSQYAAIEALKNGDNDIEEMAYEYNERRIHIIDRFNNMGMKCFDAKGAFYVFPSIKDTNMTSEEFCNNLLKHKGVAIIPGNAFGNSGEGYARVSYAYSMKQIDRALDRIEEYLGEL